MEFCLLLVMQLPKVGVAGEQTPLQQMSGDKML